MSSNPTELFATNGLVAVITGGGSGLGLFAARALSESGAKAVYIVGRREEALKSAASGFPKGNVHPIVGDVTSKESLSKVAERVKNEQGYVNLLFANAGVAGKLDSHALAAKGENPSITDFQAALWENDVDNFTNVLGTNVSGAYFTAIAFLELLAAGNAAKNVAMDSQIIITASVVGYYRSLLGSVAYSTSKAAAIHLTKMLSTTFAEKKFRIRCNCIAPGLFPSEMTGGMMQNAEKIPKGEAFEGAYKMERLAPSNRTGCESDFQGVFLFLASKAGAYMNGQVVGVDGGSLGLAPSSY
ncbi:NAD(P)-binding protein [Piedraia hortae CBS 480.64]|uniref:NAD(P)-binding protein n=1 Tax=Piedraia hortae CBS 480.64 TaxID=1314780 RepID=A0A6A7C2M1_9PEZI|nr:NAD(P)-binding protein [Piedraia hortae CBS 480.64]